MSQVRITLSYPGGCMEEVLLPSDQVVQQLLPMLIDALPLPPGQYRLTLDQRAILEGETLGEAGVQHGKTLNLTRISETNGGVGSEPAGPPPVCLVTPSGRRCVLAGFHKDDVLIGRYDPRLLPPDPDIDLSAEDPSRSVPRRSVWLRRRGDAWEVEPFAADGKPVLVNGVQVLPGRPQVLRRGNVITLGQVRLTVE